MIVIEINSCDVDATKSYLILRRYRINLAIRTLNLELSNVILTYVKNDRRKTEFSRLIL